MEENNSDMFHDSAYSQQRKNRLKQEIHQVSQFLLGSYPTPSGDVEGYRIFFNNLNSLLSEIHNELSDDEKKDSLELKNKIDSMLIKPLYRTISSAGFVKSKRTKFETSHWLELKSLLFEYQLMIFKLDNLHSADTKKKEEIKEY